MSDEMYTIGEISRLSGQPVRRIRFYSDRGLLPPAARTESNYRVYAAADVARLDLIAALRGAGVSMANIRKILSQRLSLADVLRLRLEALEAEIASRRRIASVLRATLRQDAPDEAALRRLWTVTTLSNAQFRAELERFYDRVAAGSQMDEAWRRQAIDAATPVLPDDPTPAQIDAWTELTAMITDEAFMAQMQAEARQMWTGDFDPAAYAQAANATLDEVRSAIDRGLAPASPEGQAIARAWLEASARAMNRAPDAAFLQWHLDQYRRHHGRSARYFELMAVLRGDSPSDSAADEWRWITEAMGEVVAKAS